MTGDPKTTSPTIATASPRVLSARSEGDSGTRVLDGPLPW